MARLPPLGHLHRSRGLWGRASAALDGRARSGGEDLAVRPHRLARPRRVCSAAAARRRPDHGRVPVDRHRRRAGALRWRAFRALGAAARHAAAVEHRPSPLLGARDGSLWIGTGRRAGALDERPPGHDSPTSADGSMRSWKTTTGPSGSSGPGSQGSRGRRGRSAASTRAQLRCYGAAEGIACQSRRRSRRTRAEPSGSADRTGSVVGSSGRATNYLQRELAPIQGTPGISSMAARPEGGLWVGNLHRRRSSRSSAIRGRNVGAVCATGPDGSALKVSALLVDGERLAVDRDDRRGAVPRGGRSCRPLPQRGRAVERHGHRLLPGPRGKPLGRHLEGNRPPARLPGHDASRPGRV